MIVYFSAAGNTRYVAEELARILNDSALDLAPFIRSGSTEAIQSNATLIVCSPVHVSGLPKFFADYLKRTAFVGCTDVYGVFTNAGYSGIAGSQLKGIFRSKGMRFRGYAEFKFPGIHITSVTHKPIDDDEVVRRSGRRRSKCPAWRKSYNAAATSTTSEPCSSR